MILCALFTHLQRCKREQVVVAADDLLPMLCYVALQCNIATLYAELKFIGDFCSVDEKLLSGQEGYCISMLEGAMVIFSFF